MQVNGTRMLRVKAVADMFDVSPSTIYRAIETGQLEALQMGSGKGAVRIPEHAVQAFLGICAKAAVDNDQPANEAAYPTKSLLQAAEGTSQAGEVF